jgi:hypothetical protein
MTSFNNSQIWQTMRHGIIITFLTFLDISLNYRLHLYSCRLLIIVVLSTPSFCQTPKWKHSLPHWLCYMYYGSESVPAAGIFMPCPILLWRTWVNLGFNMAALSTKISHFPNFFFSPTQSPKIQTSTMQCTSVRCKAPLRRHVRSNCICRGHPR